MAAATVIWLRHRYKEFCAMLAQGDRQSPLRPRAHSPARAAKKAALAQKPRARTPSSPRPPVAFGAASETGRLFNTSPHRGGSPHRSRMGGAASPKHPTRLEAEGPQQWSHRVRYHSSHPRVPEGAEPALRAPPSLPLRSGRSTKVVATPDFVKLRSAKLSWKGQRQPSDDASTDELLHERLHSPSTRRKHMQTSAQQVLVAAAAVKEKH
jgi:hypothetical protein